MKCNIKGCKWHIQGYVGSGSMDRMIEHYRNHLFEHVVNILSKHLDHCETCEAKDFLNEISPSEQPP